MELAYLRQGVLLRPERGKKKHIHMKINGSVNHSFTHTHTHSFIYKFIYLQDIKNEENS